MSDEKPILFVDVDGVLNCFPLGRPDGCTEVPTSIGPCWLPPEAKRHMEFLLAVFEPVWATAWLDIAHDQWHEAIGVPEVPAWPHVDFSRFKLPNIERYAGDRPWAWVDDDALWEVREMRVVADQVKPDQFLLNDNLVIAPDPQFGMTADHVDALLAWAGEELA